MTEQQLLPVVSPDLLVEVRGAQVRIVRASAALSETGANLSPGRSLDSLWPQAEPLLSSLARNCARQESVFTGQRIRLGPELPQILVDCEPAGLSSDYLGRLVQLRFHPFSTELTVVRRGTPRYGLVGASPALQEVLRRIGLYAESDAPVVVTGETGTGKELVARALHEASSRRRAPFVALNCAAIPGELIESELFGHEKGAFTGAVRDHRGRFERANHGTLFLDEIGELPLYTQAKLLRVLETGRIERVGAEREVAVDVRIVAATNVSLEAEVGGGGFRADLYHRLAVLRLHLPPLRERLDDLPELVDYFLQQLNRRYGRQVLRLTPDALHLLSAYAWPGNIRELRNVLERVYVESAGEVIGARAFAEWVRERRDFLPGEWQPQPAQAIVPPWRPVAGRRSTRPVELDADEIRRAVIASQGNLAGAARLLGVHRATLYRYLQKLKLDRASLVQESRDV